MSLAKVVPDGLKDSECKRTVLRKYPHVPYIPELDPVLEMVSALKGQHLKTTIGEDTTLHLSVWHMGSTLDAIKKLGHFQDYEEAQALYVAQREVAKQAKADLALLDGVSKGSELSKKSSKKAKEAKTAAKAFDPEMQATFLGDLKKAKEATENAKGAMTTLQPRCLGSTQICSWVRQSTCGTRSSLSRQTPTPTLIFKVSHRKGQGECHVSHMRIASCSTFSPCFPSTRLSKRGLPHQRAQEAPACQHASICTMCRAAQRLYRTDAMLLQQLKYQCHYNSCKRYIHGG
jgi:hypothetical protein